MTCTPRTPLRSVVLVLLFASCVLLSHLAVAEVCESAHEFERSCNFLVDNRAASDKECNFDDADFADSIGVLFDTAHPTYTNVTASFCYDSTTWTYVVPQNINNTIKNIAIMSTVNAINSGAPLDDEAEVYVTTIEKNRILVGTIIPGLNAISALSNSLASVKGDVSTYPHNGRRVCQNGLSYQWFPVSTLSTNYGIEKVEIVNTKANQLMLHAVTLDTCDNMPTSGSYLGSRALMQSMEVRANVGNGITEVRDIMSWGHCSIECRNSNACAAYLYTKTRNLCQLVTSVDLIEASTSYPADKVVGVKSTTRNDARSYKEYPLNTSLSTEAQGKMSEPARYAEAGLSTLVFWRSGDSPRGFIHIDFASVQEVALTVGNTDFKDGNAISALFESTKVIDCGNRNKASPFAMGEAPIPNSNNETCFDMLRCPGTTFTSAQEGSFNIFFSTSPVGTGCYDSYEGLGSLVMVHYKGSYRKGGRYYYIFKTATSSSNDDTLDAIATRHGVTVDSVRNLRTVTVGTELVHSYRILGDNNRDGAGSTPEINTDPKWRWSNDDRELLSSTVQCELQTPIAYTVTHSNAGQLYHRFDCLQHESVYGIAKACDATSTCKGYTTYFNGTRELPLCLLTSQAEDSETNETVTLYKKTTVGTDFQCDVGTMDATHVTIEVTSGLENADYEIYADLVKVGECSNLPKTTGSDACHKTHTCFSGSIGTPEKISIRAIPKGDLSIQCSHTPMMATFTFDTQSVGFQPQSSCVQSTGAPSTCEPRATSGNCAAARSMTSIAVPTSFCPVTDNSISYSIDSTQEYKNIFTVVSLSDLSAAQKPNAAAQVRLHLDDGTHSTVGYISQKGSSLQFVSRGQAPHSSRSACADTSLQSSIPAANVQGFSIPNTLFAKDRKISKITLTPQNLRVVSVSANKDTTQCTEFPLPPNAKDDMFHTILPGVTMLAPTYSTVTTSTWADCASTCSEDTKCQAYTFSTAGCELKRAAVPGIRGDFNASTNPAVSGVRLQSSSANMVHPTKGHAATSVYGLGAAISKGNAGVGYVFAVKRDYRRADLRFSVRDSRSMRFYAGQTSFGDDGFIAMGTVNSGSGFTCGNHYHRFDGTSDGQTGQCGTLRACPNLEWPVSGPAATVRLTPWFDSFTLGCSTKFWGVVETHYRATITGAEYFLANVLSKGSDTATAASGQVGASELRKSVFIDREEKDLILGQRVNTIESSLDDSVQRILCQISTRHHYEIVVDTYVAAEHRYDCDSGLDVAAATVKCNSETQCLGFGIGSDDAVKCFITTSTNFSDITVGTDKTTTLLKHTTKQCEINLNVPGVVTIDVARIALTQGNKENVVIRLGDKVIKECGPTSPFRRGFLDPEVFPAVQCNYFERCLDDLLHTTGKLTIDFPVTDLEYGCEYGGAALVKLVPYRSETRSFYTAASALTQQRSVRVASSTNSPVDVKLQIAHATKVGVLIEQDRWSCNLAGGCGRSAINISVGARIVGECGETLGFNQMGSSRTLGLTGACDTFFYCGFVTGTTATALGDLEGALRITLTKEVAELNDAVVCDKRFNAHVFTDGLMLSPQASFSAHRSLFVLRDVADLETLVKSVDQFRAAVASSSMSHLAAFSPIPYDQKMTVSATIGNTALQYVYALFDVTMNEDVKHVGTGGFACVVDSYVNDMMHHVCRMKVQENHIVVRVAQTNFNDVTELITVKYGDTVAKCGGDQPFHESQGTVGQCGTYFTCVDSTVTEGITVEITYTTDVIEGSPCTPAALAIVETSHKDPQRPLDCEGKSEPFACTNPRSCLPVSIICNNNNECNDGSDENRCTNWNFVLSNAYPLCAPLKIVESSTASSGECKKHAVLHSATTFTWNTSMCALYTCLDFSSPQMFVQAPDVNVTTPAPDATTPTPDTPAPDTSNDTNTTSSSRRQLQQTSGTSSAFENELYIFTTDPSIFKYCTDALHCNNNGRVVSSSPPCQCECDVQYHGNSCGSLRDISLVEALVVVVDAEQGSNSSALATIMNIIKSELPGYTVNNLGADSSNNTDYVAFRLQIFDTNGNSPSQSEFQRMLTADVQESIIAKAKAAQVEGFQYLTVTSVVGNNAEVYCRKNDYAKDGYSCSEEVSINNTRSVSIVIPGVVFDAAEPNDYIEVTVNNTDGTGQTIRCSAKDFTSTKNPSKQGLCANENKCTKSIANSIAVSTVETTIGQTVNVAAKTICESYIADITVSVEGYLELPTEVSESTPQTNTTYKDLYLYLALGLMGVGGLCLAMLLSWFKMKEKFEAVKYAGPLFGAGAFFFILFAVCVYAYYLDTAERFYTHQLVVEEYRDELCDKSGYSYIPHRISYVPADGECHQLATVGTPEGISYISVTIPSNKSANYKLKQGGTLEKCKNADVVEIQGERCVREAGLFPKKPQLEQHHMMLHGLQTAVAQQRIQMIESFNPPSQLTSSRLVDPLVPTDHYDTTTNAHTFYSRGIKTTRSHPVDTGDVPHFLVLFDSDVPSALKNNASHPRYVIYKNTITTKATLFTKQETHDVSSLPFAASSDSFTNYGFLFNGYGTGSELSGVAAYRDAHHYRGIDETNLDVGKLTGFTINFWISATSKTRGLVYAVTDNWITNDFSSPIATQILNVIENSESTTDWFSEKWNIYSAVYVNGDAKSLHLVWATNEGGVKEVRWDTSFIGVDRIFDGQWHYVSIVVDNDDDKRQALIYVDGQTSFSDEGWVKCLSTPLPKMKDYSVTEGTNRLIFNKRQEQITPGGLLLLGHLNAGLYDFHIETSSANQETVISEGAEGMDLYSTIAVTESLVLGMITLAFAAIIILYSIYQGWQHTFGINEDIDEDDAAATKRPANNAEAGAGLRGFGGSSASSVQFWQFITPVTSVAQFMGLYFGGFTWPATFRDTFAEFYDVISLNLFLLLPSLPVLLWPIIQFFISTVVLFALLHFAIRDNERHGNVIQHYRETQKVRNQKSKGEHQTNVMLAGEETATPNYRWEIHVEKGKTVPATPEQVETLERTLTDLMTTRHRREANMRLHTKKLIDMGNLGTGIILYERINGKVLISFRASDKSPEEDKDAESITLTQTVIEQVADNVECPEHGKRLLPDDLMTSQCVHSDNPFYRSMACPRNCIMYRCPHELCDYAVCEFCYNGGTISGALSGALAKVQELRKHGAIGTVGTVVVILAGIVYLPVIKNAMMIIFCHPSFQCVFTKCWSDADMMYVIALLMSFLVVIFVLLGFIIIEIWLLRKRHRALVETLPVTKAKRQYNCWLLPQNIVKREDYVDYLKLDNSMLKSLYEPFEFSYFWFAPAQLVFKAVVVISLVTTEPDSLTQLTLITFIEIIFAMGLIGLSPYKNVWIEAVARLGSFHQLVQLGLMGLHRVDIRNNPSSGGYSNQMIAASALYLLIVVFLLIIVVIVPNIRKCWFSYKRRQEEENNENQRDIYDIGFWGNPNRTDTEF